MSTTIDHQLTVLRKSVARLHGIASTLDARQLRAQAYPSEWTIADVLSHIGSAAVIMQTRIDAARTGSDVPDDFAQPIWAEWNAKSPEAKAADAVVADAALLQGLEALTAAQREHFTFAFGPMTLGIDGFIGMRLNEHVLHTWDIEVVLDPKVGLQSETVEQVVDRLELIVRFAGKPTGVERTLHVQTTEPHRDFTLALTTDAVALHAGGGHDVDLEIPAEAFVRLVYGRLDPAHSPRVRGEAVLEELRGVFRGI